MRTKKKGGVFLGPLPQQVVEETKAVTEKREIDQRKTDRHDDDLMADLNYDDPSSYVSFARGNAVGVLTKNNMSEIIKRGAKDPLTRRPLHHTILEEFRKLSSHVDRDVRVLSGMTRTVSAVAVSHDGKTLVSSEYDTSTLGKLYIWDIDTLRLRNQLDTPGYVYDIIFSLDDTKLACECREGGNGYVEIFNLTDNSQNRSPPCGIITSLCFSNDGTYLVVAFQSMDGNVWKVDVMNITTSEWGVVKTLSTNRNITRASALAMSHDGAKLAIGYSDGGFKIVNVFSWQVIREADTSVRRYIHKIAFSENDQTILVWKYDIIQRFENFTNFISNIDLGIEDNVIEGVFSSRGDKFAVSLETNEIKIYETQAFTIMDTITNVHAEDVSCINFSPDGRYLVSGGDEDKLVKIWDISIHAQDGGGKKKEYTVYKKRRYLVRYGKRGGKYILVGKDKQKVYV